MKILMGWIFIFGGIVLGIRGAAQEDTRTISETAFQTNLKRSQDSLKTPKKMGASRKYAKVQRNRPVIKANPSEKPLESLPVPPGQVSREIAVTVWRLRPSRPTDPSDTRMLIQESTKPANTQWTPERILAGASLKEGDRVRLSIQSPRNGYLYVIDREKYADGSVSAPYLIFPTRSTNGGDNQIFANTPIEIPAWGDQPNFFSIRELRNSSGKVLIGEELSILVISQPIREIVPREQAQELDPVRFAEIKRFETEFEQFELVDGPGLPYQDSEKQAANGGYRKLTRDTPLPQTIFRTVGQADRPLLVSIPLLIGK